MKQDETNKIAVRAKGSGLGDNINKDVKVKSLGCATPFRTTKSKKSENVL